MLLAGKVASLLPGCQLVLHSRALCRLPAAHAHVADAQHSSPNWLGPPCICGPCQPLCAALQAQNAIAHYSLQGALCGWGEWRLSALLRLCTQGTNGLRALSRDN